MSEFRKNQKVFKDTWLRSKVAPGEYWEIGRPGFGLRVSDTGRKTFILAARFSGKVGGRRALGVYPVITLEAAHAKANKWLDAIRHGYDPARLEEREKAERLKAQKLTFAAVVEDFIADKLSTERKGKDVEREIRLDLLPAWAEKPITEISTADVIDVIDRKSRKRVGTVVSNKGKKFKREIGGKVGARNLLALIKRLFRWAISKNKYGLTTSPAAVVKADEDATKSRDRTLTNDEIFAFWRATDQWPTYGPAYRLLMLTGLRLHEAVDISRNELDPLIRQRLAAGETEWRDLPEERSLWVIPKERMKGKNSGKKQARAHAVPMTDDLMGIFAKLDTKGKFLFSLDGGENPVTFGTKEKDELDRRMLVVLRELASKRGEDPAAVTLDDDQSFVNHDIRRTVRSHLSRLKIEEVAREAVLAHARLGIKGVYDTHTYREEKREALLLWAARLRTIVEPTPRNVVTLASARNA
jgi:Arm domain-containing DNA-binding protein